MAISFTYHCREETHAWETSGISMFLSTSWRETSCHSADSYFTKSEALLPGTGVLQKGGADLARYTHHGEGFFHGTIQNNIQNRKKTGQKQFLGTHCHAKDRCKIFCKLGTQQGEAHQLIWLVRTRFSMTVVWIQRVQIGLPQHWDSNPHGSDFGIKEACICQPQQGDNKSRVLTDNISRFGQVKIIFFNQIQKGNVIDLLGGDTFMFTACDRHTEKVPSNKEIVSAGLSFPNVSMSECCWHRYRYPDTVCKIERSLDGIYFLVRIIRM